MREKGRPRIRERLLKAIVRFVRSNSRLRTVARYSFWQIERWKVFAHGTSYYEKKWGSMHLQGRSDWGGSEDWVDGYWNSRSHQHRPFLIDQVLNYEPDSVLEFGCNCGPNLYLLNQRDTNLTLSGIDVNPEAIRRGNELFAIEECKNVKLMLGGIDALKELPDASVDVVLTDAVLLYVGSDMIYEVIVESLRLARLGVVMLEWHDRSLGASYQGHFLRGHWLRDYQKVLEEIVPSASVRITKLPDGLWDDQYWSTYGHIIEVNQVRKEIPDLH